MTEKKYKFVGKLNIYEPQNYLDLHNKIREYFPEDKSLKIEQAITSVYSKGKKKANVEMNIRIITENGGSTPEIKGKLEEILGNKLIERKIK